MRKKLLRESDLPQILKLLEKCTFAQVAAKYGYNVAENNGNGLRKFLENHGIDCRIYAKPPLGGIRNCMEYIAPTPKIIKEYMENGYIIRVYEARFAGYFR